MSLRGNTNEERIWNFLSDKGLSPCGVGGLMGNLYWESALIPTNLQNSFEKKLGYTDKTYTDAVDHGTYTNFAKDGAGYGLAQWTYHTRKAALLAHSKAAGRSVGDLECQLDFLYKELSTSFKSLLSALKTATAVRAASDLVLTQFERPANMGESVKKQRADAGQKYVDKYGPKEAAEAPTTPVEPLKPTFSISTPITTAAQLAAKASLVAKNYKTLYVMGCFGAPLNAANKARYCTNHTYNKQAARTAMIQAATADTFGFDCVCLIKGLLWGWCGDKGKTYGGAQYATRGVPDIGADQMIRVCKDVSTDFRNVEVGEAVWTDGHIGVYIGNGLAVECTPRWKNCVQITACNCNVAGYNRRDWKKHGKLPYVTYDGYNAGGSTPATPEKEWAVGDTVMFTGNTHYVSANGTSGKSCKPGKAKITAVYNGKHPYHLVRVTGGGSTVYGWVDAGTFTEA